SDAPTQVDLVVRHGAVITMDDAATVYSDGAVAILDGEIAAVGPDAEIAGRFIGHETIDAGGAPVHPGLIEAHLHCSYQLFRGALSDQLREGDDFSVYEGLCNRNVEDGDEELSALLASLELLRHGTSDLLEPGTVLEVEAAASGIRAAGIRAELP